LHRQIRDHATKRSAGKPERANDVKLSRGGIREIEFTVQLLQVVRGGQFPELRTRPTQSALQKLAIAGLMPKATADALSKAYVFLRQVEHRIQYLDDQQTHILPTVDADLEWIATTMGFESICPFLSELDSQRELVAQEFDALLGGEQKECKGCAGAGAASTPRINDFDEMLRQLSGQFRERVSSWREHPRVLALREESRARLVRLVLRTAQWVGEGKVTEESAVRIADWIEPLLRRESYLALLLERPSVHERLLHMLGAARWPARYLLKHPGVIDELAGGTLFEERFDPADFEQELERRREAHKNSGEDDDESLLNLLRRAHHAEVFRTLARDIEGRLTVEQVADDLSALAEAVLRITTNWCWDRLKNRHRPDCHFGVVAYGKLGGKELGYGSDLDIVFVYDDEDERAGEVYGALVRKLINWLTVKTGEGDLYEIDTALRPNGNSGLLVSTFNAYADYQCQRGENTAWTWEHQAMTRARFCLGSPELKTRFDEVRANVINAKRDQASLRQEIVAMRDKLRAAHAVKPDLFDVKHSAGGMVDVEFAVQYLVLAHAQQHPSLLANVGNIALLLSAEKVGLVPAGVGEKAGSAYRELRRVQHRARLDEQPTQVPQAELENECAAIKTLWQAVFG
jgi:glutamate-ammonia-ligase adenylyltransferase